MRITSRITKLHLTPARRLRPALCAALLALAAANAHAQCAPAAVAELDFRTALTRLTQCNRDVIVARQIVEAARADLLTADRAPNPSLTVGSATINPQAGLGAGYPLKKQIDWQARIDQPIERGNKRNLRVASATSAIEAAQWAAVDALRQQKLALALAWIDAWAGQEQVRLANELLALYRRTEDAAKTRLAAGDIAANDLARISVDTQRAANDVRRAEADRNRARIELARLLALDDGAATLTVKEPWAALSEAAVPPATLEAARSASRPDLLAARAQLKNADDARALARSLRERDVSVGVQVDRYPPPAGTGNSFSLSLSLPLFTGHAYEGEAARAEADYTGALLNLQRLELQAVNEQQRAVRDREAAATRARQLRELTLPLSERIAANADLAYKRGAAGVLDLLDALRQLRQMQGEVLAAQTDFAKADALARAAALTGGAAGASIADPVFAAEANLAPKNP